MKHSSILTCVMLALASGDTLAQDAKQPETGATVQGGGQGQADVQADQGGVSATGSAAGSASAEAGKASANVANGTEIDATLTRSVDAGRARPGDEVTAKAAKDIRSEGKVVVPRGSRLIGRVTSARQHRKGDAAGGDSASQLGIVFDRAVLKDGSEVALNGSVAAIGATRSAGSATGREIDAGAAGAGGMAGTAGGSGGGLAGGVGGTVGGVSHAAIGATGGVNSALGASMGVAGRSAGAVGGLDAAGGLKPGSRGVFGLRDLDIQAATAGAAEGSVITSAERNVRLESGTQMLLVAGGSAGQKPAAAPSEPAREPVDRR